MRANLGVMSVGRAAPGPDPAPRPDASAQWSVIVGALVLLLWIPLRERPGLGTVSNVVVIGLALDAVPAVAVGARVAAGAGRAAASRGILVNGVATAAYVGASLGPGSARRADDRAGAHHRAAGRPGPDGDRGLRRARRVAARRQPRRSGRSCSSSPSGRWSTCSCRCSPSASAPPGTDPAVREAGAPAAARLCAQAGGASYREREPERTLGPPWPTAVAGSGLALAS